MQPNEVAAYIADAAMRRGIDPAVAVRVASSEGLREYVGDGGSSFGPFQLHYGGVASGGNRVTGLGDDFTRRTGLDARDPSTWRQQVDFALDHAAKYGWGAFHGARNVGLDDYAGLRMNTMTGPGVGGRTPPVAGGGSTPRTNMPMLPGPLGGGGVESQPSPYGGPPGAAGGSMGGMGGGMTSLPAFQPPRQRQGLLAQLLFGQGNGGLTDMIGRAMPNGIVGGLTNGIMGGAGGGERASMPAPAPGGPVASQPAPGGPRPGGPVAGQPMQLPGAPRATQPAPAPVPPPGGSVRPMQDGGMGGMQGLQALLSLFGIG